MIKFVDGVAITMTKAEETAFLASLPTIADETPTIISARQFWQQLAIAGLITQDEALAVVRSGVLPAAFVAMVEALPSSEQFATRMKLTVNQFDRSDALVSAFASSNGIDDAGVDAIWLAASKL